VGKSTICIHCISIAHLVNKSIAISLAILSMKSIVIVIATVCAISSRICLLSANIKSNSAIVIRSVFRANLHKSHKQFQHSYHHLARRRHAAISSLVDRREQLSRKFFTSLLQPSSCLHILLPTPQDPIITTRLRSANKFPRLPSRTRKYQTFISYALAH